MSGEGVGGARCEGGEGGAAFQEGRVEVEGPLPSLDADADDGGGEGGGGGARERAAEYSSQEEAACS